MISAETRTPAGNHAPVANAGPDQTILQCAPAQICLPASCSDPDGNLKSCQLISGPGSYDGSRICFTPTGTLNYEFVLKATDSSDVSSFDTVVVYYTLNRPPVANAGRDSTLFLCGLQQICWPASCGDPDGNLANQQLISGPGTFNGSTICFTPSATWSYQFVLQATDSCGRSVQDTSVINVTMNRPPSFHARNDTTMFLCGPAQVCLPFSSAVDPDNNVMYYQVVSGPGSLIGGNWCYTPPATQTVTVTIRCVDSCNAYSQSTFTVQFKMNHKPTVTFGSDTTIFQCAPQPICLPYAVGDVDNNPGTEQLVSGPGTIDTVLNRVCFTPPSAGTYALVVRALDSCGAEARDTIYVTVTINRPPVVNAGPDQSLFLCSASPIIWLVSGSDPDGNLDSIRLVSGPGIYAGGTLSYTPTVSGTSTFIVRAYDHCGLTTQDTVRIAVTMNDRPQLVFGSDTTLSLCQPQQVCLPYTISDPNGMGKLTEVLVSGFGSIDTAAGRVCFTPTAPGTYQFIASVTDSCGASGLDTISATIVFGQSAQIICPGAPITASLCTAGQVCQQLTITPANASVTTSLGSYANGTLCFQADTSGTYHIRVISASECGSDTCVVTFNVAIGQAADISCPDPQTRFVCQTGLVCVPITVLGSGAIVTATPTGSYNAGDICFQADSSGHYVIEIRASTPCGTDSCQLIVDVTIDAPPVAINPTTPRDTFVCSSDQVCFQFAANDVNGGALTWSKLSGAGTVSGSGQWCFTPTASGSYGVIVAVADSCGRADTTSLTFNTTLNQPPAVNLGPDISQSFCRPGQVCVNYSVADQNGNVTLEQLVSGIGTIDTAANRVCYSAGSAGTTSIVVRVIDACGAADLDTVNVTLSPGHAPVVNAGVDQTIFQCSLGPICWPVTVTDLENNLDSLTLISGTGALALNGGRQEICFTPTLEGTYTFVLRAVDSCQMASQDTVVITVQVNHPPVCSMPHDTLTFFQCAPTRVSLSVDGSDPDNNFDHCEIVRGPGSIDGGQWVFTPSTNEFQKVVIRCLDRCGAACSDSFYVNIKINAAPVVNSGKDTTIFLCHDTLLSWPVEASDPDNNLMSVELLSGPGTYDAGTHRISTTATYEPGVTRQLSFVVKGTDSCHATGYFMTNLTLVSNSPPSISVPSDFTAYLAQSGQLCFYASVTDPDGNVDSVTVSPFAHYISGTGQVCFQADSSGSYCVDLMARDRCGLAAARHVCITVVIDGCLHVQIERVHDGAQGVSTPVNIYLDGSGKAIGNFELLVSYDAGALTVTNVRPGQLQDACGWEYFWYRAGTYGPCSAGRCPSGLMKIVGVAEISNGAYHPNCFLKGMVGTLATLDVLVSNNWTLNCKFLPIDFFWVFCQNNSFTFPLADTVVVSRTVFDAAGASITNTGGRLPTNRGVPESCVSTTPDQPVPERCIDFTDGGIDVRCSDTINPRGDINQNGLPYEIADVVMFSNYFVSGLSAFPSDAQRSIAASDVNADGVALQLADLVYLIRVVGGEIAPHPKGASPQTAPVAGVTVTNESGKLAISGETRLGGAFIVVAGRVEPELLAKEMTLDFAFDGVNTRVLITPPVGKHIDGFAGAFVNVKGQIVSMEFASVDGLPVLAKQAPIRFALSQNYPNPFNPATRIELDLPRNCDVQVVIFNLLGQKVRTLADGARPAGTLSLTWDGRNDAGAMVASGVYLCKANAEGFSDTRKMVLLK